MNAYYPSVDIWLKAKSDFVRRNDDLPNEFFNEPGTFPCLVRTHIWKQNDVRYIVIISFTMEHVKAMMYHRKIEKGDLIAILPCQEILNGQILTVQDTVGQGPEALIRFTDHTHTKVKHLVDGTWGRVEVIKRDNYGQH